MISNSRWFYYLLSILIIAVLLFNLPMLQARALFNSAQIARLQGYIQPDLYTRALAHTPDDVHMRWQTGDALAEAGAALKMLQELMCCDILSIAIYQDLNITRMIKNH